MCTIGIDFEIDLSCVLNRMFGYFVYVVIILDAKRRFVLRI